MKFGTRTELGTSKGRSIPRNGWDETVDDDKTIQSFIYSSRYFFEVFNLTIIYHSSPVPCENIQTPTDRCNPLCFFQIPLLRTESNSGRCHHHVCGTSRTKGPWDRGGCSLSDWGGGMSHCWICGSSKGWYCTSFFSNIHLESTVIFRIANPPCSFNSLCVPVSR